MTNSSAYFDPGHKNLLVISHLTYLICHLAPPSESLLKMTMGYEIWDMRYGIWDMGNDK